ncbi:MAG: efflux transporter outer membrane subunit [Acidobacteria bacterium]|nr:efflux transporter outer membrane subunit [Acidobacteriota bacterium]
MSEESTDLAPRGPATVLRITSASAVLLAACSLAPAPERPDPAADMPERFAAPETSGTYEPLEWWQAFGDPVLDRVVDSVIESNLDMAAAVGRVRQARERARIADAAVLPVLQGGAGLADLSTPGNVGFGGQIRELGFEQLAPGFPLPDRLALTTWSLSADFAYEMDFWGRAASHALAAGAEFLASASDYHAAGIGVVAETIGTYLEIIDFRRRIELTTEIVDVLLAREQVASTRYDRGLTDSLDLHRVRQDLRNTQASLTELKNGLVGGESRLAVLLGGYREDVEALLDTIAAPETPADPVPAGIPADLLLQRPDVMAARHRMEAARHAVSARRAELLPALSLSGSIGLQACKRCPPGVRGSEIEDLFRVDQWFANLASNLLAPVFNGGRLRSNVSLAEARFTETAAIYGSAVVTAVNEVETSLAVMENKRQRHALLHSRLEEARATVDVRSQRYEAGIGSYPDYLDALRTELAVESALTSAERDLALARLAIHRALGGAWTHSEPPDGETVAAKRNRTGEPAG